MVFCGIDWAEEHHDVCLVDESCGVLWRRRIDHDPSGIDELRLAIAAHESDPAAVLVAIETGRGLLVAALVELGYTVYPSSPKAAERYRDLASTNQRRRGKANYLKTVFPQLTSVPTSKSSPVEVFSDVAGPEHRFLGEGSRRGA